MCWGVRNLKRLHGLRVNPLVEVECGARDGPVLIQPPRAINDKKNANFPEKLVTFDVVSYPVQCIRNNALGSLFFLLQMLNTDLGGLICYYDIFRIFQ